MLNPFKLLAIYGDLNKLEAVAKEKGTPMTKLMQYITLAVSLVGALGVPAYLQTWLAQPSHQLVYGILAAAAILLHAICPSIFAASNAQLPPITTRVGAMLLCLGLGLAFTPSVYAQTATTPPATTTTASGIAFTGSSAAIALHYNGAWGTGNLTTESLDFMDFGKTKSQHLFVEGKELIASSAGFNVYAGGVTIQPDLTKLLAKTNVAPANLSVAFNFDGGAGIPAAGNSHIAFLAGGQVQYKATSSLSWNALQVQWLRYGSMNAPVISSGLSFIFGHS